MPNKIDLDKKIAELEDLERYFQQSTISIDEGLEKYKKAQKLVKEIKEELTSAENSLEEIAQKTEE